MPLQPTWLARIPNLLGTLQAETLPAAFTRRDLECLLGVRRRRAILLLHRIGAERRGSELIVLREALLRYLQERWNEEAATRAAAQERHVADTLAAARRALTLPRIPLPSPAQRSAITFAGLPAAIRLTREDLAVAFSSAQDLVEKLFALAQALANDYESLEEALAGRNPEKETGHGLPL